MARGKYAARAANARAGEAQESVSELRVQLAAERQAHAEEVSRLNTRIQQLSGQLTSAVGDIAAAEIQRVREECRAASEHERADRHAKAIEAFQSIREHIPLAKLHAVLLLLDLHIKDIAGDSHPRTDRRGSRKKLKQYVDLRVNEGVSEEELDGVANAGRKMLRGKLR